MGKLRWYKRDPNAALVGMRVLSCEERGAYNTVLDLIYAHDGKVIDDDRYLAGECALHVRVWRRIRARLLDLQKVYVEDGHLKNNRADNEVELGLSRVESARNAGRASAAKRSDVKSENNNLAPTTVGTVVQPTTSTTTPTSRKESKKVESALRAPATQNVSRGTRLPDAWQPDDDGRKFAVDTLGSNSAARSEFDKFNDHWRAQPGSKGVKTDWPATWRNWCRKAVDMRGNRGPPQRKQQPSFHEIAQSLGGYDDEATHARPGEDEQHSVIDAEPVLDLDGGIPRG